MRPDLLIVNTHELLLMAALLKVFLRLRILYDIRENYRMNLLHTRTFPRIVRHALAGWVYLKERVLTRWFDHILLAEEVYRSELGFLKQRPVTVIENKAFPIATAKQETTFLKFVFTGTLAESTGVFKVTDFVRRLHQANGNVRLKIVGRCALERDRSRLFSLAEKHPWLELQIHHDPVPHEQIEHAIAAADFGLVCYPHSTHTRGRVPTKLFEYMAAGIPILMEAGPVAKNRAAGYEGLITVEDFRALDPGEALRAAGGMRRRFLPPPGALWPPEGMRLCDMIGALI
jgi:glycosyltransferase involved in cell wall biosynthesis